MTGRGRDTPLVYKAGTNRLTWLIARGSPDVPVSLDQETRLPDGRLDTVMAAALRSGK